jgi:hypothetical protein
MMTEEDAAEIHEQLHEAAAALARAEAAIFINLDKEGWAVFAKPLDKVVSALRTEVLPIIYKQFPHLEPRDKYRPSQATSLGIRFAFRRAYPKRTSTRLFSLS